MPLYVREHWATTPENTLLYAYTSGTGLPLVFCNGIGVSTTSFWSGIIRPLAHHYQTIHWDYRGHGYSDPPPHPETMSIRSCAEDLRWLLDDMGLDQVVLVGHSMGVQVCFEFFRWNPQRVKAIVPILGTYQHPFDNFMRRRESADIFRSIFRWVQQHPDSIRTIWPLLFEELWARPFTLWSSRLFGEWGMLIHPKDCPPEELSSYLAHMRRICPLTFFHLANSMQEHSAADILGNIHVPTLIFAADRDIFTPLEASENMQQQIPDSTMTVIPQGSHAALAERPEIFWKGIHDFLQARVVSPSWQSTHTQMVEQHPSIR